MIWLVTFTSKAKRQAKKLPAPVKQLLAELVMDLRARGPVQVRWPNYGSLKGQKKKVFAFHCHLKSGRPTYVACWLDLKNAKEAQIEIFYVGTHESAPY